ncbi:MAG TPA: RagB/SusD family nutrient uptake outer membrane protein, partial [Sphingobacteriaceae bacterium]
MNILRQHSFLIILIIAFSSGCRKMIRLDPPTTQLVSSSAFSNNDNAAAVLTGIYTDMIAEGAFGGFMSVSAVGSLASDEFVAYEAFIFDYNIVISQAYRNSLNSGNVPFWRTLYNYIYRSNAAIEGLNTSTGVTPAMKDQLTGEAKFIRAFCHFYLVNLFGEVPLITTTDYRVNRRAIRTSKNEVYTQIIDDLKEAEALLNSDYLSADNSVTEEKVRPNKFAAMALLARVYLYTNDWQNAEAKASEVIESQKYFLVTEPDNVFIKNSVEAIWQLPPVLAGYNTLDGYQFTLTGAPNYNTPISLSSLLTDQFADEDRRRAEWVGSVTDNGTTYYFPTKYNVAVYNEPV